MPGLFVLPKSINKGSDDNVACSPLLQAYSKESQSIDHAHHIYYLFTIFLQEYWPLFSRNYIYSIAKLVFNSW